MQYTGRRGYYHALGPTHAHTIYAGTPAKLKSFLLKMQEESGDTVNREIQKFLNSAHTTFLKDQNIEAVKSYQSARDIYLQLIAKGMKLDKPMLLRLFTDQGLRDEWSQKSRARDPTRNSKATARGEALTARQRPVARPRPPAGLFSCPALSNAQRK